MRRGPGRTALGGETAWRRDGNDQGRAGRLRLYGEDARRLLRCEWSGADSLGRGRRVGPPGRSHGEAWMQNFRWNRGAAERGRAGWSRHMHAYLSARGARAGSGRGGQGYLLREAPLAHH